MREIGACEAKNKLGRLLDEAERAEEIVITRRGKARLVPMRATRSRAEAHAAVQRILARAESRKLGHFDWAEWKPYRDEGHS